MSDLLSPQTTTLATTPAPWWRDAVCYQVYVRSFADSNGDGIGDLPGITSRLDYLRELGVGALWLTPFFTSPQADHGYDVADYRDVDPLFGTLADFDVLAREAHARDLRLIIDIVPNHSSDQHEWFREALDSPAGSAARSRYHFRDGQGPDGDEPPNDWPSVFGGPAWTRTADGQWYLHLFDSTQPDFDWDNPDVSEEFESVLRFWLDRGADGLRVDVAHGMFKAEGLPDVGHCEETNSLDAALSVWDRPFWNQPGVHDVYRKWRRILSSYDGDRMAIGEAWVPDPATMAEYLRPDELHQVFNFHWLQAGWTSAEFAEVIRSTLEAVVPVGASPTWVLESHDVIRSVSRYGGGESGLRRARAAAVTMFALPGAAYVYGGEELGLPQVDVAIEDRQDPTFLRGGGEGRDGCRVPLPWTNAATPMGFGPAGSTPWLPQPDHFAELSVEVQAGRPDSTLSLYRRVLGVRAALVDGLESPVEFLDRGPDVLAFRRPGTPGRAGLTCILNFSETPMATDDLGDLLVSSEPLDGNLLPTDTAAWFSS